MSLRLLGQIDRPFATCLFAVIALGLYNLASAGRPLGASLHFLHGAHLVLGLTLALIVASVPYRHLEGLAYPIFFLVVGLLLSTMFFGRVINGSRRWLTVGPMTLQTSDLAKLAVIVIVARTLHMERWEGGGMTLRDVFRPFNLSRPVVLLGAVFALSTFGPSLRPPKLERWSRTRFRPSLTLRETVKDVLLGKNLPKPGERGIRMRTRGVAPRHALLQRSAANEWVLTPVLPKAEVLLNGERITSPVVLGHGDVVQLGANERARIRFSNSLERARPLLPWVSLVGIGWLIVALRRQWRIGQWRFRDLIAPIDVVLIPCALILGQPDLGTTLVVMLIAFSMILYVGLRPMSLLILITGGLAFAGVAWRFILKSYQKQRVLTFLNPTGDLAGAGYHQHQSLIAVGSGEWLGKGHGQGTQTQLSFLPEQQTDFIFSVWAEEQGFLGSALVVMLFAALILASLRVAQGARDRFGALLVVGVTSLFFWHSIVNMLMVLRLAPVVGVPLPLWSKGGSFVMTTMVGVGLILNVNMRRRLF